MPARIEARISARSIASISTHVGCADERAHRSAHQRAQRRLDIDPRGLRGCQSALRRRPRASRRISVRSVASTSTHVGCADERASLRASARSVAPMRQDSCRS
jgi:hypothetical protein